MRSKNGSPLPLARNLRWIEELQGLSAVLDLHDILLLALLCCHVDLALE